MSIKLYDFELSQSGYRVRLLLSLLGLSYETKVVNVMEGEQKVPEYLHLNPLGKVPYLEDGEAHLRDSHAIIVYQPSAVRGRALASIRSSCCW